MTLHRQFEDAIRQGRLVALATVLTGPQTGHQLLLWPDGRTAGSLGDPLLETAVQARTEEFFAGRKPVRLTQTHPTGPVELFVDVQTPPLRLFIVGAVHTAAALVTYAKVLGFQTIVVDARAAFATPERFGHADQLIVRWPAEVLAEQGLDESSCVVTLTHDEKFDNPALAAALRSPALYIGALGSQKTHAKRRAALAADGLTDTDLQRIHAPIGLRIGARRPEEIALSIMAEIVAVVNRTETTGNSLAGR